MSENEQNQENGQSRFHRHLSDVMIVINATKNNAANLINRKTVGLVTGIGTMGASIPVFNKTSQIQGDISFINNMSESTRRKMFEGLSNAEIVGSKIGGSFGEMAQGFIEKNPWVLDAAGHEAMPYLVSGGLLALGGAIAGTAAYKLWKEQNNKKTTLQTAKQGNEETPMIDVAINNSQMLGDFYDISKEQLAETTHEVYDQELIKGRQQFLNVLKKVQAKKENGISK